MKYDKKYVAEGEMCPDTVLYVGYVPGFPGAHSQGKTEDELRRHLKEVIEMLLLDGELKMNSQFVGTQLVEV